LESVVPDFETLGGLEASLYRFLKVASRPPINKPPRSKTPKKARHCTNILESRSDILNNHPVIPAEMMIETVIIFSSKLKDGKIKLTKKPTIIIRNAHPKRVTQISKGVHLSMLFAAIFAFRLFSSCKVFIY
jgi:hypothetical protein